MLNLALNLYKTDWTFACTPAVTVAPRLRHGRNCVAPRSSSLPVQIRQKESTNCKDVVRWAHVIERVSPRDGLQVRGSAIRKIRFARTRRDKIYCAARGTVVSDLRSLLAVSFASFDHFKAVHQVVRTVHAFPRCGAEGLVELADVTAPYYLRQVTWWRRDIVAEAQGANAIDANSVGDVE